MKLSFINSKDLMVLYVFAEPPDFTEKPPEYYQKPVGSEVVMSCDGVGNPKPMITWRRVSLFSKTNYHYIRESTDFGFL